MNPNMQTRKTLRLRAKPEVLWLQDGERVLVLNQQSRESHWFDGDAAMIWAWLNSGVSFSECVNLLAVLNDEEPSQAMNAMILCLADWQESGFIYSEEEG